MTGNPSGITNTISMTTTASTARSDADPEPRAQPGAIDISSARRYQSRQV